MSKKFEPMGGEGQNAAEILADVKAGRGNFRELKELRYHCPTCPPNRSTLVRVYVGNDDEGELRHWFLISGHSSKTQKIAPRAYALEVYEGALIATCQQCKSTFAFFHDGGVPFYVQPLGTGDYGIVVQDK